MAPKRRKEKKLRVPDDTISDLSAYLAQVAENLEASAGQVSGSSGTTSSSGSSYSRGAYRGGAYGGNVLPGPSSPTVRMVEEFMRHKDETDDWLTKWYSENHEKVEHYEYIRFELLYFLSEYIPGIRVDENIHPHNLVELVKDLVTDLTTKFNKFNLELREISGHEIAGYIQDHHRKVIDVVEDYERQIKIANDEIAQCKEHIVHLDAELSAALTKLTYLERGTAYYGGFEDSVTEEQFMADLHSRVAHSEMLSSSMKDELEREKQQNEGLKKHVSQLAREKVETEEKCMKEIVELSQRAEINSMLERGLQSMLQQGAKEPNTQDCQKLIDQWKNEMNQAIDQNSKEIDELLKRIEGQNKDMAALQAQAKEQDEQLEEMQRQVQNSRSLFDKYKAESSSLQTQKPSPIRLHSTFRDQIPGQSRIPRRIGATSSGWGISTIKPTRPRARTPQRVDVSRISTGYRSPAPHMPLTTPRAGTSHRLGTSGMGPAESRTPPRVGGPSGMRPAASRAGTPPRPRMRPTAPRARAPQRMGIPARVVNVVPLGDRFVYEVGAGIQPAAADSEWQNVPRGRRARQPRPHVLF